MREHRIGKQEGRPSVTIWQNDETFLENVAGLDSLGAALGEALLAMSGGHSQDPALETRVI